MIRFNEKKNRMIGVRKDGSSQLNVDSDMHIWIKEDELSGLQVAVYVMCGGGFLGRFAACQPADFYIDDRVGKLPYSRTDIMQVIEVIKGACMNLGKDPRSLPEPKLPGCWVF